MLCCQCNHLGVVCDKQGEATYSSHQVLQSCQSNGQAIVGGSAPPQLIHDDQGALGGTRQYGAGLTQLLHPHTHTCYCMSRLPCICSQSRMQLFCAMPPEQAYRRCINLDSVACHCTGCCYGVTVQAVAYQAKISVTSLVLGD